MAALYEYGYVVQDPVDGPTLIAQILAAGLPAPVSLVIEGAPPAVTVFVGYDVPLTGAEQVTLSGVMEGYTASEPTQYTAIWRIEDKPVNGRVLVAREYQDYDPGTGVNARLVRRYDYNWQGSKLISVTITEYKSDGSVLSVRNEPVYTTSTGGRASPVGSG